MTLRNGILCGLGLCILPVVYSLYRYPEGPPALLLAVLFYFAAGILWYGHAAIFRTHPDNPEDQHTLDHGIRWGLLIGSVWVAQIFCENILLPRWLGIQAGVFLAFAAFLLPIVSGAVIGIRTGKVRSGMRAGFWTGLTSGGMSFLALATVGYVLAFIPGLPGAEIPKEPYTADQFQALNVADAMGGALTHFLILGAVFCAVAGGIGAASGIALERTGRAPDSARTPIGSGDLPKV
jgi:hypothetical protein